MANNPFGIGQSNTSVTTRDTFGNNGSFLPSHNHTNSGASMITSPKSLDSSFEKSPEYGIINYSPKHSRKPSSLSMNRNINMKNLSLNLGHVNTDPAVEKHESGDLFNKPNIIRRKTLTLSLPSNSAADDMPLVTPSVTKTPSMPPLMPRFADSEAAENDSQIPDTDQDRGFQFHHPTMIRNTNPFQDSSLQSPFMNDKSFLQDFSNVSITQEKAIYSRLPEELQEQGQLEAYPRGPANVLNSSIYLFSDPNNGRKSIDINEFDLVINVAKECKDMLDQFDSAGGKKEYLYIPWSHTSLILKELPKITKKMSEYDDSNTTHDKRKILVHCQCGVSRSACVVVAYFMFKFEMGVNEAYELLKSGTDNINDPTNTSMKDKGYLVDACDRICPNMSLIFELMEFSDFLKSK